MVRLTRLSLTHRTIVLLLSLLTIGLGVFATTSLKQEMIPSMDIPQGSVVSVYAGAAPAVVEAQVSKPIESAVKAVDGVTSVTSTSSSGMSQVAVEWEYGIDLDDMANKLRSAVDSISASLPSEVDSTVVTGGTDDIPVIQLAVSSDEDLNTLSKRVTDTVVPELKAIDGVRDVSVAGEEKHEIVITYKQTKLDKYGVDPSVIGQYFSANSAAFPSGTMRTDSSNIDVQTGTTYSTVREIADLRVPGTDGPVRLGELATVKEKPVETTSISRVEGRSALTLSITKTVDANTVAVSHAVQGRLGELTDKLGGAASFVVVSDQAPYIEESIHNLTVEGAIGLAMAILVILIFLRSIRPTLITAISIPLSLLIALIGLWLGGYTLNILTLGALTVAIGRVVDDSIVVIENIKRHQGYGETGRQSITNAVKEVAGAITSSTLTTVAVFLPIGLVGGQAGQIFRPFAVAAVVALLASLLVSLTVVPVFASWFMRTRGPGRAQAPSEAGNGQRESEPPASEHEKETWLQKAYLPVLNWSLAHRWLTLLIALGMFIGTLALIPGLKTDFIGSMGSESISISQKLPSGSSLTETDQAARRVEAVLAADPDVQTYTTTIGGSTSVFMGTQADTNEATLSVPLKPGADPKVTAQRLRQSISDLGDGAGEIEVSVGVTMGTSGVVVYVEGSDSTAVETANQQVLTMMQGIAGLTNVASDMANDREMLSIDVNEKKAAELGMTQASIGQAVARSVRGQLIGTLAKGDTTMNVYLRSQAPVKNIEELRAIKLPVTQTMNQDAMSAASDKVTAWSDRVSAKSERESTDSYNDQVKELKNSRASAKKSVTKLNKQLSSAKKKLTRLQRELERAQQNPNPNDPAVTVTIFQLTQQISGAASQVAQLSSAVASSKGGVTAIDDQLDSLAESRSKSLDSQAEQEAIADAREAASEATAKPTALKSVAKVEMVQAPTSITRVNGTRAATITASSESSDLGGTTSAIQGGIASLDLPDGVSVRIGGVSQQQSESFAQLGLAMVVAVAAVYLIMVGTFGSLLQPMILLVSIPFAATGALGLSLLTDTPLGIASMIGLLMLIGIVVTNAIVLIDLINQKRKAGASVAESIQTGARLRVRPIVMTALATIFALVPMALGLTGGGVFISKPLAIVVIGGLLSSTVLTLILVPVLYDLMESWRERRRNRRGPRTEATATTLVAES